VTRLLCADGLRARWVPYTIVQQAVVLWIGGVGFVGSRYVEDTASGKLGAAQELTMSGEKRRGDSSYSDKASGGGSR
jgi:hypothetical protein